MDGVWSSAIWESPDGEVAGESSDIFPSLDLATSADYLTAVNDDIPEVASPRPMASPVTEAKGDAMERQQQLLASLAGEGGGEGRGGEAATATSELEHKPPPPRGLLGDLASASAVPSGGGRQGQPPPARPRGRRRLRFVYKRRRVLHLDDLASASSSIPAIDIASSSADKASSAAVWRPCVSLRCGVAMPASPSSPPPPSGEQEQFDPIKLHSSENEIENAQNGQNGKVAVSACFI
uniref:Uncharacterized protein n=1 Tax=Oryza sativa subsp. japonica TaxID=39947 RepID=Q94LF7_ORYSJ|nr:Hypothetical protein [Oryza sativa Japonica Group]